jgi:hypothetical protein
MTTRAFVDTNPKDEPIASGLFVIRSRIAGKLSWGERPFAANSDIPEESERECELWGLPV